MKITKILSSDIRHIVGDTPEDKWVNEFEDKPTKMARILIDILERAPWKKDPKVYNLASVLFKQVVRGKYKKRTKDELKPYIKQIDKLFSQFKTKAMPKKYQIEKNDKEHHNASPIKVYTTHRGKVKADKKELKKSTKVKYAGRTMRLDTWVSFRDDGTIRKKGFSRSSKDISARIYVVDCYGQFYISKDISGSKNEKAIKHSSFFNGNPVAGAGKLYCNNDGKIIKITNSSGHYQPGKEDMRQTLLALKRHGTDLSKIKVVLHEGKKKSESIASDWDLAKK
jgi:hypothetical protein